MRRTFQAAAAATAILALAVSSASSEEGMWTFDNFPKQLVSEKLGV